MNLAFFVTDLRLEEHQYTTYWLSMAAVARGHTVWHISAADLTYTTSDRMVARARRVAGGRRHRSSRTYFDSLQSNEAVVEEVDLAELDVLMLRTDPGSAQPGLEWAHAMALQAGRLARKSGVVVLNDPDGLSKATDKLYLQLFPASVRPETIITRTAADIKSFAREAGGSVILKPIQGSGGKGVFLIDERASGNFNQIVDSLLRDGYVIAQEYIPQAREGDTRVFVMNGVPLESKGKYAAFRRRRSGDDVRSNVHVGAKIARAEITDEMLELVAAVRPRLMEDGMFLVGLDIVGEKILEINVFCPGGLRNAQRLEGVDFAGLVIEALERKDRYLSYYRAKWYNINPAVL